MSLELLVSKSIFADCTSRDDSITQETIDARHLGKDMSLTSLERPFAKRKCNARKHTTSNNG